MRRQKKLYILLAALLLVSTFGLNAQNQNWYFGFKAGLNFSGATPTTLFNGQNRSYEACASISDRFGNLLFYTSGDTVWNKSHNVMSNGFGLLGDQSTTQGALIVPDPGDTSKYYIFTLDDLAGSNGLRYSVVDMSLASGNGAITAKNVLIQTNLTEKLSAIRRCDGNVWIIYHGWQSNNFITRLITPAGIGSPIISAVGLNHSGGGLGVKNSIGYLKISNKGDKVAVGILDMGTYQVLDFDINTGLLSNPITLNSSGVNKAFALEFSPDGRRLYTADEFSGRVYQYDLTAGSASAVDASETLIGTSTNAVGALQVGRDGKIYIARNNVSDNGELYLATIANPNLLSPACIFTDNGLYLDGRRSRWNLPNDMIDLTGGQVNLVISGDSVVCFGDTATLTVLGSNNIQWVSGSNSNNNSIKVVPTATGIYRAVNLNSPAFCRDTFSYTVNVQADPTVNIQANDTVLCFGDSITLTAVGPGVSNGIVWSGGLTSNQNSITVAPIVDTDYFLNSGALGCIGGDTLRVFVIGEVEADIITSQLVCSLEAQFSSSSKFADAHLWDFGDGTTGSGPQVTHLYPSKGKYRVKLLVTKVSCGFTDTSSILISVGDTLLPPKIQINERERCNDGTIDFEVLNDNERYSYYWDIGNGYFSTIAAPITRYIDTGTYRVILTISDTACGEVYQDTAEVVLNEIGGEVFIPNAFTPNQDGLNEEFVISGSQCGEGQVFEIYSRWGTLIFRTNNPFEEFWDGTFKGQESPQGVYVYLLRGNGDIKSGYLSIIR